VGMSESNSCKNQDIFQEGEPRLFVDFFRLPRLTNNQLLSLSNRLSSFIKRYVPFHP
jgi:hypothetical protein